MKYVDRRGAVWCSGPPVFRCVFFRRFCVRFVCGCLCGQKLYHICYVWGLKFVVLWVEWDDVFPFLIHLFLGYTLCTGLYVGDSLYLVRRGWSALMLRWGCCYFRWHHADNAIVELMRFYSFVSNCFGAVRVRVVVQVLFYCAAFLVFLSGSSLRIGNLSLYICKLFSNYKRHFGVVNLSLLSSSRILAFMIFWFFTTLGVSRGVVFLAASRML